MDYLKSVLFLLNSFFIRKQRKAYCGKLRKYRKNIKMKIYTFHNFRVKKILVHFLLLPEF